MKFDLSWSTLSSLLAFNLWEWTQSWELYEYECQLNLGSYLEENHQPVFRDTDTLSYHWLIFESSWHSFPAWEKCGPSDCLSNFSNKIAWVDFRWKMFIAKWNAMKNSLVQQIVLLRCWDGPTSHIILTTFIASSTLEMSPPSLLQSQKLNRIQLLQKLFQKEEDQKSQASYFSDRNLKITSKIWCCPFKKSQRRESYSIQYNSIFFFVYTSTCK